MSFEPQKFFIGVIDFFSILLPGAVLTYLYQDAVGPRILDGRYWRLQSSEGWVVFLFSSYVLGHFLFFIGAWLDDYVYDPIRRTTDKEQIRRLLNGRKLSPSFCRWLASVCFKSDPDAALDRVIPIKESYLKRIEAPRAINAFQWSKARLIEHPEALATVNRFEADSKFFRSFVPVMVCLLGTAMYDRDGWLAAGWMIPTGLAFLRYMEQRFKSTQQAYWHILTLEASKESPSSSDAPPSPSPSEEKPAMTLAGGVVFRQRGRQAMYLLLQASVDPTEWVLPKGNIEPGEDARRCAIREVKEETGVWARIKNELKVAEYDLAGTRVRVQFYLMEAVGRGKKKDRWREHEWAPLDRAVGKATYPESKELLRLAEQMRTTGGIIPPTVRG